MKIVYIPLDERPCNYAFAQQIAAGTPVQLIVPEKGILGDKKMPANIGALEQFLKAECAQADACVLSLDMLLYGGIIPSRLHHLQEDELVGRLKMVRELKRNNPALKIFAFALIMRCPGYSSADEEPDYYETCGREIFLTGQIKHKLALGLISPEAAAATLQEYANKTGPYLEDFENRRRINRNILEKILTEYRDCFEVLVIPQDDSSAYGYTTVDREYLKQAVAQTGREEIPMYPGADEVGMSLLANAACSLMGRRPGVKLVYAHEDSPNMVPLYEDRPVGKTIPVLLNTSGCGITTEDPDITLYLNYPAHTPVEVWQAPSEGYKLRDLDGFCDQIAADVREGRLAAVADCAYCNGGDAELVQMLSQRISLTDVAAYAGWNTSSNTLGTVACQAVFAWLFGKNRQLELFTAQRLYEDVGYCGHVRREVTALIEPMGFGYFDAGERNGAVAKLVRQRLEAYMKDLLPQIAEKYTVDRCQMPWKRMFEVDLTLKPLSEGK
jgi:hypothetical protein